MDQALTSIFIVGSETVPKYAG